VLALLCLLACALTPAIASARVAVPPGSSEGDQYFEEIPNGAGSGGPERGGGDVGGSSGSQEVAAGQALRALGDDGAAAADGANANRPPIVGAPKQVVEPESSSTEGEGGIGSLLPILIVVTALGAIAYGLRHRLNPA
jgi:hypothetical protein